MDIWRELGIEATSEARAVRRAYAARLKQVHPEDDPERFQALRQAYEIALGLIDMGVEPTSHVAQAQREELDERSETPDHDPDPVLALVAQLSDDLAQDDGDGAALRLAEALNSPALTNLDRRAYLELQLLEEMAEQGRVPPALAAQAAASFDWHRDLGHLPPAYRVLARDLLTGPSAEQRLAELGVQARTWPRRLLFDKRPLAAALLLGPYRPRLFAVLAMSRGVFHAMAGLIHELRCTYPEQMWRILDPATVAWWDRTIDRPGGPVLAAARYLVSAYWIYGGLLVFALATAFPDLHWFLALPIIVLSVLDLVADLMPSIYRAVVRLFTAFQRRPSAFRRGFLPTSALGLAAIALIAGPPASQYAALAAFPFFAGLGGERDFLKFLFGTFALFWLVMGLVVLDLLPEPRKDLLLLFVQAALLAGLRIWRLADRPRTARAPQ